MKQTSGARNLSSFTILAFFFCVLMSLFAVGLYFEYQAFLDNFYQMQCSKNFLNTNNTCFEYLENDFDQQENEETTEESCDQEFLLVNRNQDYLKEDALEYAKKHNLGDEIGTMYGSALIPDHQVHIAPKTKQKATPLKSKRKYKPGIILWPLDRSKFWLSSRFGPRKKGDGSNGFHYGIDMAAARGTVIRAAGLGTVIEAGMNNGYGKTIVIAHADGIYQTRYAHLDHILVKRNQRVFAGQKIGTVGNTGAVRGQKGGKNAYHLHFEVKRNKKHIDPLKVLSA